MAKRVNPKTLANLKPFQRGQSGNPDGRAVGVTYVGDWLRGLCRNSYDELASIAKDKQQPATRQAAARLLMDMLHRKPEVRRKAIEAIADRTEGKPVQAIVTTSPETTESVEVMHEKLQTKYQLAGAARGAAHGRKRKRKS